MYVALYYRLPALPGAGRLGGQGPLPATGALERHYTVKKFLKFINDNMGKLQRRWGWTAN